MPVTHDDHRWMSRALQLAERGRYTAKPNPCVGCVIVGSNGVLLGEGWHQQAGQVHAEVNALKAAGTVEGATAYITLEPCSHYGRTGPCVEALINAGIKRVVCAMKDPNPLVSGQGFLALTAAGLVVDGPEPEWQGLARQLNPGFIVRMEQQRPLIRAKVAVSLDGRTAMASGESQWITGAAARRDVQRWRARSSAVVTGIESILLDNSRLSLRRQELGFSDDYIVGKNDLEKSAYIDRVLSLAPIRVVLDSQLRIPVDAAVLDHAAKTMIFCSESVLLEQADKVHQLTGLGEHIIVESLPVEETGRLSLSHLLCKLANEECNEILVEAGATLTGAFVEQNLIDELIVYQAPILLGSSGRPMVNLPLQNMVEKKLLTMVDQRRIGDDQRMILSFH